MESFSSIFKFIIDKKLVLLSIVIASAALYYGPIERPDLFPPSLPEPWLQINLGVGIAFSCLLLLGLLQTLLKLGKSIFLFLHAVGSRYSALSSLSQFDRDLLEFMYNVYPESIDIYRLNSGTPKIKPAEFKMSLGLLVQSGYVHAPWQDSYSLTDLGLQKAKLLIENRKREQDKT